MNYKVGEVYDIRHSRHGEFKMKITDQCETWLHGTIVEGLANAMMEYNTKGVQDDITIRKSLIRHKQWNGVQNEA